MNYESGQSISRVKSCLRIRILTRSRSHAHGAILASILCAVLIFPGCSSQSREPVYNENSSVNTTATQAPTTVIYIPVPVAEPAVTEPAASGPSEADLENCDPQITRPSNHAYLTSYDTKRVNSPSGNGAYMRAAPDKVADNIMYTIKDNRVVTVYARENGFSLVQADEGEWGWITSDCLS